MIKGIGASSGIAMGRAFVVPTWEWDLPEKIIDVSDLAGEFEKLYNGIRSSKDELEHIKQDIVEVIGPEPSHIFDAHMAILEDPVFMNEIEDIIERQSKAAEVAVKEVIDKFVDMFNGIDDEYMKERALDIKDVGNRLLKHLLGDHEETLLPSDEPYLLVGKELTPSQLAHLDPNQVLGVAMMLGGMNSHTSIMMRAMSIPYVLGLEGKLLRPIHTGDFLILDGDEGVIYVNPDDAIIFKYQERKMKWLRSRENLKDIVGLESVTQDGREVHLAANMSSDKELEKALSYGASGVGLFRSEMLYMDRATLPTEQEQYEVYVRAAETLGDKPLVIRTLDIGGDKKPDCWPLVSEDNPFLGYRAIRISLDRKDRFKAQLRAILRAAAVGNVKVMYPMISSLAEVREANAMLETAKAELMAEGIAYAQDIEVGIMIEVPGAALIADVLAKEVSFFSIGTNDLVQYTLAVDRMNEKVAYLYEPFHPAVIRLLKLIADAAKRAGISIAVCGEMAGDVRALPLWLGLGIQELSMSVPSLLQVKQQVMRLNASECEAMLEPLLACGSSEEIHTMLSEVNEKNACESI
ncbi:phosphoenolpyruvate--protein phosphotransferase [Paenibacillus sp. N1-5-1-14]|uniref:phosphoenolpyruvate--protein phosphotransferase n=1 Tax=Paenibacillus radicibacter TaxID=2972488 RepID=UPI0021590751|nr:phosphoenolpyruvate--protein phosphotransferase [Paenibacillus radicibacter]MCR8641841.1 phosphoenolpyruvate--protein phosphotransferase [Paenibacillus radicibacter]